MFNKTAFDNNECSGGDDRDDDESEACTDEAAEGELDDKDGIVLLCFLILNMSLEGKYYSLSQMVSTSKVMILKNGVGCCMCNEKC